MPSFPYSFPYSWPGALPYPPSSYPTFGDLAYNGDHADEAVALLLEQFHDLPLIDGLVRSFVNRSQELEDQIWMVLVASNIDVATAGQLDGIGAIVGEERRERTNDEYRAAIKVRILINRCDGRHGSMLHILTTYMGAASGSGIVVLTEPAPAALDLDVYAVPTSLEDLRTIARTIKPAGVNLDGAAMTTSIPFRFGWTGGDPAGLTGAANGIGWSGNPTTPGGTLAMRL